MLPWLRQQAVPIDQFLSMPIEGLKLMQSDQFGRMRPIPGRTATLSDLLALHTQTSGPSSPRWTVVDEAGIRQSIHDAVLVLRGPMNHNARVEAICNAVNNTLVGTAVVGATANIGGTLWLENHLPDAPSAAYIQNIAGTATNSAYHVPLSSTDGDAGAELQVPGTETGNASVQYSPTSQSPNPSNSFTPPAIPVSGWQALPTWQQPLPTTPEQMQQLDLQTDNWVAARSSGQSAKSKFQRVG